MINPNSSNNSAEQTNPAAPLSQPNQLNSAQHDGDRAVQGEQNSNSWKRVKLSMTEPERTNTLPQAHSFPASIDLTEPSSKDPENIVISMNEEDMDTFDLQQQAENSISLSSQLKSLRGILGARSTLPSPPSDKARIPAGPMPSLQLPNLETLQDLTDVFFKEMNTLLPVLNQNEAIPRITRTLNALGYNGQTGMVSSSVEHAVFLGMIFWILAIADTEAPDVRDESARLGWNWFQQGQQLSKYFGPMKVGDSDRVGYYTLGATYLLRLELLSHASAYIMQAWNAATVTGMNDQRSWPTASHSATLARQKMWWALYYLDTHVARRRGRPYLIRDSEVAVAEFVPQLSMVSKYNTPEHNPVHEYPLSIGESSSREMEFNQTSLNFARIWKQIWDTLFSARLGRYAHAQDVEILDARIIFLERITPSALKWRDQNVLSLGESEIFVRRRLLCQLQLNLYRMIVRQNPLRRINVLPYEKEICAALARENISTCADYILAYPNFLRPAANLLTFHLSESLYHLSYSVYDGDTNMDFAGIIDSFKMAYGLVKKLARSFYGARTVLRAIMTSYCALKRTAIGSSTLEHLVDFVCKEHEALINDASPHGESVISQQQDETSQLPVYSSNLSRTPGSSNDDTGLSIDLNQLPGSEDLGLQWPVMGGIDLGAMQGFTWPELELGVQRDVLNILGNGL